MINNKQDLKQEFKRIREFENVIKYKYLWWTDQDYDDYEKWKDRLAKKEIGLDALMNLSAFYSFATDQKALDDRIESLL